MMTIKSIKQVLLAGTVFCGMSAGFTACSDWDDHYEGTADATDASSSLWQQMEANPQLSDFCEVLKNTMVYRMHEKKPVSYADILKGGQAFTVLAPVNGTFDKASLLEKVQTVTGDSAVEKSFVQNHLLRRLVSITPNSAKLLRVNQKWLHLADGKVEDVPVVQSNIHAHNGVLHVIQDALDYKHNLYEMFCDNPSLQTIGSRLRYFDEDYFDDAASVSSGVVEGVPVYVDSVVYERNRLLESIGKLKSEDSTYVVVAPTTEGWNEAWDKAVNYFQFKETIEKRDSLQQYFTVRALLEDAVFNMTEQKSPQDSLISVPYNNTTRSFSKGKQVYHLFQKPFDQGGILYGAEPLECSNGTLYTTQKWPFSPLDTYFKEIYVEGENNSLIIDYDKCIYGTRQLATDSISEGKYLRISPIGATDNWTITYQVNNTLSGNYDIYAVVLPKSVYNQTNPDLHPNKFKATISYVGLDGKTETYACKTVDDKTEFQNDPERVDSILIAENFHFPACNYGQSDLMVTVKISCSITARQTSSYAREMFLDCIYLRPRLNDDQE